LPEARPVAGVPAGTSILADQRHQGNHAVLLTFWLDVGPSAGEFTMTSPTKPSALLTFAAALLASALFLSACNTAEGVGDDVEEATDEVGDAID
jgi:predicted small secreted protein